MNRKLTLCFVIFLFAGELWGQVPFFHQYPLLKKRESLAVNAIHQDRQGFIWLGTTRGLIRFDGKDYIQYTVADSLPDNKVTAIAEDSLGRIWTGHANGKIAMMTGKRFVKFEPQEGSSVEPVSDILFDGKGNLWFSTLNDGLYFYRKSRLYRLDEQDGMPDLYVYDLALAADGTVYAGTDRGIAACTLNENKVDIKVLSYEQGLPDNISRKFAFENDDKLWVATEDAGVYVRDLKSGEVNTIFHSWSYGPVSDLLVNDNYLWIACPEKGLVFYDRKNKSTSLFSHDILGTTAVNVLMRDLENSVWCGSKAGPLRTSGETLRFIANYQLSKDMNTLAIAVDSLNEVWYSSSEGFFRRSVDSLGIVTTTVPLEKTPYKNYTVISLYADPFGYIWAGLYGEGVLRINSTTGKIQYLSKEIRNGNVLSITGKKNTVWLATLGGVTKIETFGEKLQVTGYGVSEGLSSDFIYQVFIDSKDRKWFATDGKGIDMLDGARFYHFEKGLPSKIIYSITEGTDGKIWVNVQGHGLYFLDDSESFSPAPEKIHPRNGEIFALTSGTGGNLVMMHEAGLDVVNTLHDKVSFFGDEAGLRDKITNLNATCKDRYGNIYFGTSNGIVIYNDRQSLMNQSPAPQLTTIRIYDSVFTDFSKIRKLGYDKDNFTFSFVGLWYQNPDELYYRYFLENYDLEWISTGNTSVTYSKLPPGSYKFRVQVSSTGNFQEAKEASFSFEIDPPFWRTPAFYMFALVAFVVAAFGVMRFRERRLEKDKMVLEARVRRRTREVQRQNEEIQAQNEEIMAQAEEIKGINENLEMIVNQRTLELERKNKALEEYAFINAHKLRSPVASILGLVNLMSKTGMDTEGIEISKRLKQSAEELDVIVRSITKAIENGENSVTQELTDKK
jgi:ligand-binding sensor domain-containing protein